MLLRRVVPFALCALILAPVTAGAQDAAAAQDNLNLVQSYEDLTPDSTGYAPVNGLEMYYEVYGEGEPLLLLHGAYGTIGNNFGAFIPALSEIRQVIGVELQGHGRTADSDRPLSYKAMASDVAGLIEELGLEKADIFGYSMGGSVALRVAIDRPDLVDRLVVAAGGTSTDSMYEEVYDAIQTMTAEDFAGTPMEQDYLRLAPNPEDWPVLVKKLKALDEEVFSWPESEVSSIEAPALVIVGDGDVVRPEHAVELFRLLGGGVPADLVGPTASQLAIVPGATHITLMLKSDMLLPMILPFLEPEKTGQGAE
ncbi:alpha/beta fold hydrolase [Chelativorans sp. YIM 93263]|uniref:alpha/beta fold hydrolase n=1 Tax=Chelativorans sp. YIM 93263 TaxID=2906648 RepID=UPI0023795026|nr:alpha/beta hydrolase [Chelativorans sp. YIM 93263]